jgi:hypothetical protein
MTRKRLEKTQHKKFVEAARELGADGSEEEFDRALKRVAKSPSQKTKKATRK